MAEVQGGISLKRACESSIDYAKRQRVVDNVENSGDISEKSSEGLQRVDQIHNEIYEAIQRAEQEKERITSECAEVVQKRLQERYQILQNVHGFWALTFRQSRAKEYLTEDDEKLLDHLIGVEVEDDDNQLNITLRFSEDNPYLQSCEITRVASTADPNILTQVSEVAWKPGQEFCSTTDESGYGAFSSCDFFQRFTSSPHFDAVDRIIHDVFWDPMPYFRGIVDLAAEAEQDLAEDADEDNQGSDDAEDYASDGDLDELNPDDAPEGQDEEEEDAVSDGDDVEDDDAL